MKFQAEYTRRAVRDLKSLSADTAKKIIQETIGLEDAPFPHKQTIKRLQGLIFPCYRLRIDLGSDSFRVFYDISHERVFILRVLSEKEAEKVLKGLRTLKFPPDIDSV